MKDFKKGQWVVVRAQEKEAISFLQDGLVVLLMKVNRPLAGECWLLEFPDGTPVGIPFTDDAVQAVPGCFEPAGIEKGPMVAYVLCAGCKKVPLAPWENPGARCGRCATSN